MASAWLSKMSTSRVPLTSANFPRARPSHSSRCRSKNASSVSRGAFAVIGGMLPVFGVRRLAAAFPSKAAPRRRTPKEPALRLGLLLRGDPAIDVRIQHGQRHGAAAQDYVVELPDVEARTESFFGARAELLDL